MGLTVVLNKEAETTAHCVYVVGADAGPLGRLRLRKPSGDVEVLDLSAPEDGSSRALYLAQAVPRLQAYHDAGTYPDREQWTV